MKVKSTKSALLMSFTSLLLCFAMLIGSTFAWFTDSVTSGVNKIVAGNLDVEVEYSKDGSTWADLQNSASLFTSALWEPGHTEVVYLKIKNAGTLALKYDLKVSPVSESGGINVEGNPFKLSDYIKFGTTEPGTGLTTYSQNTEGRAAARNIVADSARGLNQAGLSKNNSILAQNGMNYITLVVYMPEDVGNVANYKTGTTAPYIDLGITVLATQVENESDSFGQNYDAGLTNDATVIYNYFEQVDVAGQVKVGSSSSVAKGDEDAKTAVSENTVTVKSAANAPAATVSVTVKPKDNAHEGDIGSVSLKVAKKDNANFTVTVPANSEVTTFDVKAEVTGAIEPVANAIYTVKLTIGAGKQNLKLYHGTTEMSDQNPGAADTFTYDPNTGVVTMYVNHFSEFTAVYDEPVAAIGTTAYYSLATAVAAAKTGETVTLLKDIDLAAQVEISGKEITLNMAGRTIKYVGETGLSSGVLLVHNGAGLTVTGNGKVDSTAKAYAAIALTKKGDDAATPAKLTVQNGTFIGNYYAIVGNGSRHNTEITINDGKFSALNGLAVYHPQNGTMTVKGGTFTGTESAIELRAGTLNITGGTFTATADTYSCNPNGNGTTTVGAALAIAQHTTKKDIAVNITGGTFNGVKALSESNPQANDPTPQVAMSITGGTFNGEITMTDVAKCITGGTFSVNPATYVKKGYEATANATETAWTVEKLPASFGAKDTNNTVIPDTATVINKGDDLVTAINAGGTVYVAEGTYNINTADADNKTVTIIGAGAGKTILRYGNTVTNAADGEAGSCYSFEGSTVTFKDVTLEDVNGDNTNYEGFVRVKNITFENCVLKSRLTYCGGDGVEDVTTFKNCTFDTPEYNMWAYGEKGTYHFENCLFKSTTGKFINAYREKESGPLNIEFEGCRFECPEAVKAYGGILVKNSQAYVVSFDNCETSFGLSGVNTSKVSQYGATGSYSDLYVVAQTAKTGTKVTVDGTVAYSK